MKSKRSLEGYLFIDGGPAGISREFVAASGKDVPDIAPGGIFEGAVLRCTHCGVQMIRNLSRMRERGHCRKCDKYVCDNPGCRMECRPVEKQLDIAQERAFRGKPIFDQFGHIILHV